MSSERVQVWRRSPGRTEPPNPSCEPPGTGGSSVAVPKGKASPSGLSCGGRSRRGHCPRRCCRRCGHGRREGRDRRRGLDHGGDRGGLAAARRQLGSGAWRSSAGRVTERAEERRTLALAIERPTRPLHVIREGQPGPHPHQGRRARVGHGNRVDECLAGCNRSGTCAQAQAEWFGSRYR